MIWPLQIGLIKKEKFKKWTDEEIESVLDALAELPKELWSSEIKGIYRAIKSKDYPNPASSGGEMIVIYDSAFTSTLPIARILGHELAHRKFLDLSKTERESYLIPMNWLVVENREKGDLYFGRKDGYVLDDGRGSPDEDFANNLEFYLFELEVLKKITPHAYRWFHENFNDKLKLKRRP